MTDIFKTIFLLTISNVFMSFAWYAHLKNLSQKPWIIAALLSWAVALFEYLFQVPANRIGFTVRAVKNFARSHYLECFCAIFRVLYASTHEARFFVGRFVLNGCSVFYV